MNIKQLTIKGYKSIGEIVLEQPNPFSVFVGANGAGKSNIFEALEFLNYCDKMDSEEAIKYFGKLEDALNKNLPDSQIIFDISLDKINPYFSLTPDTKKQVFKESSWQDYGKYNSEKYSQHELKEKFNDPEYKQLTNFTRLFVGNKSLVKRITQDNSKISIDGSNLERVLKRILQDRQINEELTEIFELLISGFFAFQVITEKYSGMDTLLVYDKALKEPLTKNLISDGTVNILSILTAIYQSDTPQFLCIEEPENGLNPKVVKELVNIIRTKCIEKGHYIWLNTHSQTLVSQLQPEEIILVDKVNGMTQTKQITGMDLHGLKMDEALLTNSLGGGIPW